MKFMFFYEKKNLGNLHFPPIIDMILHFASNFFMVALNQTQMSVFFTTENNKFAPPQSTIVNSN